ncbi:hypothetical protein COOONC_20872 [Cooperia oncophora]
MALRFMSNEDVQPNGTSQRIYDSKAVMEASSLEMLLEERNEIPSPLQKHFFGANIPEEDRKMFYVTK